ncbi:hypothetical protein OH491_24040 [Termitidicoccus mucosus]|uniref:Uncharacterized protein n=1 Tax=Termitidicoccus mucosus TaxID=1184151 RepID=A0A178IQC2_9BACT|nr:hypothetical protein AW736_02470 [Opitutaceae bacterium TSB47]OAM91587.1 hypothetical protein AW736_02430 [Opitutaceae bacterium TSB47]
MANLIDAKVPQSGNVFRVVTPLVPELPQGVSLLPWDNSGDLFCFYCNSLRVIPSLDVLEADGVFIPDFLQVDTSLPVLGYRRELPVLRFGRQIIDQGLVIHEIALPRWMFLDEEGARKELQELMSSPYLSAQSELYRKVLGCYRSVVNQPPKFSTGDAAGALPGTEGDA